MEVNKSNMSDHNWVFCSVDEWLIINVNAKWMEPKKGVRNEVKHESYEKVCGCVKYSPGLLLCNAVLFEDMEGLFNLAHESFWTLDKIQQFCIVHL